MFVNTVLSIRNAETAARYSMWWSKGQRRLRMLKNEARIDLSVWSRTLQDSLRSNGAMGGDSPLCDRTHLRVYESGCWSYVIKSSKRGEAYASIAGCDDEARVIEVPQLLDGLSVREIEAKAFAWNKTACRIVLPDTIDAIGSQAFLNCSQLEGLVFPPSVEALDWSVLSGCSRLREVVLPASLRVIPRRLFVSASLRKITISQCVERIERGAFNVTDACEIEIVPENPFLSTDGIALFDKPGEILLSALKPISNYRIPDSCRIVSDSSFKGMFALEEIELGQGVEEIGAYAFFGTSITGLVCPNSLVKIGDKAFASSKLREVKFDPQLEYLGEQAFACTKLKAFSMPRDLCSMGSKAFWRTGIDFGNQVSSSEFANGSLVISHGCLYERGDSGLILLECLSNDEQCRIEPGTIEVRARAFEGNDALESVLVPEGVISIGDDAFRLCRKLCRVQLPDSLQTIGSEAFWGTGVRSMHVGPLVTHIGENALEFAGDSRNGRKAKLECLSVSSSNECFYSCDGLLIERKDDGDHVLLHDGNTLHVKIPDTVIAVDGMAFYNSTVMELSIPSSLKKVSQRAFLGCDGLEYVHVEYPKLVNGVHSATVLFPIFSRDRWDFSRSLRMNSAGRFLDFAIYDSYTIHEPNPPRVVEMALARLLEPIDLDDSARANYESAVLRYMELAIVSFEEEHNEKALSALLAYAGRSELISDGIRRLGVEARDQAVREIAVQLSEGR